MALDFLTGIQSFFSQDFQRNIAVSLDEDLSSVNKAIGAIVPLGMGAIIQRVASGKNAANALYTGAHSASQYIPAEPDIAQLHGEPGNNTILSDIMGAHKESVAGAVAKYAGIKHESAGPLMNLVVPALVSKLGTHIKENNMSPDDFETFVSGMKDQVKSSLPDGMAKVASVVGLSQDTADEKHLKDYVKTEAVQPKNKGWVLPIILAVLAVALLVYFSRGCNPSHNTGMIFPFFIH